MLSAVGFQAGRGCLAGLALGAFAFAGPAFAGDGSVRPNYTFPAGLKGFQLTTRGGPANPGLLVGFNPQPEPPTGAGAVGAASPPPDPVFPETTLDLTDPFRPVLTNLFEGDDFTIHFWILGHGDLGVVELPPAPNSDGFVNFRHVLDGHVFDINFKLGPNQVDPRSWRSFDPQPDPPGAGFGVAFSFTSVADPQMFFDITLDGKPLEFALAAPVPEPEAWALMILGFGMAGGTLRRRRALAQG